MRTCLIVLSEPLIDNDAGLIDAGKPLRVQHFSAERAIEALVVAILPR